MKKLQYQLCNGNWKDAGEKAEKFIAQAEKYVEKHPNPKFRKLELGGHETVIDALNSGNCVHMGQDWYDQIRYEPAPIERIAVELVKCDCGHSVPQIQVMSASLGKSCPDCYDRMSM